MNDALRYRYITCWWIVLVLLWIPIVFSRSTAAYRDRMPLYEEAITNREQAAQEYARQIAEFNREHASGIKLFLASWWDRDKDPRYMAENPDRDEAASTIVPPGLVVGFWGLLAAITGGAVLYLPAFLMGTGQHSTMLVVLRKQKAREDIRRERRDDRIAAEEDMREDVDEIAACLRSIDNGIRAYVIAADQMAKNLTLQEMQAASGTIRNRMRSPNVARRVLRDSSLSRHARLTVQSLFNADLSKDRITLDLKDLFRIKA